MAESIKQMSRGELEKLAEKTVKQRAKQRERQSEIRKKKRAAGLREYTFWAPSNVPDLAPIIIFAEPELAAQMRRATEKDKRIFEIKKEMVDTNKSEADKDKDKPTARYIYVIR